MWCDVGDVHKLGLVHRVRLLFESFLHAEERLEVRPFELRDPAFVDLVERDRVEVVELLPAVPDGRDQPGGLEHGKVLCDALPGCRKTPAQPTQGLALSADGLCRPCGIRGLTAAQDPSVQ